MALMGFVADAAVAPSPRGFVPDPPEGEADQTYRPQPDAMSAATTFAKSVGNSAAKTLQGMSEASGAVSKAGLEQLHGVGEATAFAVSGMATSFLGLAGGSLSSFKQWVTGKGYGPDGKIQSPVEASEDIGRMMEAPSALARAIGGGPGTGKMTSPLGQDYSGLVSEAVNQVLMPLMGVGAIGPHISDMPVRPKEFGKVMDGLPPILQGELARRLSGQVVTAEDFANVAKVEASKAGPVTPEAVAAVESSLRSSYVKTGIGPFSIAEEAARNPELAADLKNPAVDVPKALEPYLEAKPAAPEEMPGDMTQEAFLADQAHPAEAPPEGSASTVGELPHPSERADELRAFGRGAFWSSEGGKMIRAPLEEGGGVVGEVTGRTPWIPAEEWFGDMRRGLGARGLSNQKSIQAALEKSINDEPLSPIERRTVDYIRQEEQDLRHQVGRYAPEAPHLADEMMNEGLSARDVPDAAMMRRAAEVDPVAFNKAADEAFDRATNSEEYSSREDPAFIADIQRILATEQNAGAHPSGEGVSAAGSPGEQSAGFRPGAGTLNAGINPELIASTVKETLRDVLSTDIAQEGIKAIMPMSTGTTLARATSQKFANAVRVARFQFQRMGEYLEKSYTPTEREAMWNAADEQNTLLVKGEDTAGKGLDRLTPKQRADMEELHSVAESLWQRAQDAGMVKSEGLPFWTPRMAVLIGEDGEFRKPPAREASGEGGVTTTASSLKQRKYVTAEETEAAMKGALGDNAQIVRDVRTFPLAMSRMAQAIAGRELVNQLKEFGQVSGKDIVADGSAPGYTTIDHPAFMKYRPDFITDETGKVVPRVDQEGNPVMLREPLHINDEWAGPLRSVLSSRDGAIYSAYMLMKSKAMTAIMASPMAHNMVIWGRALAYDPAAVGTLRAYFSGHALVKNTELMTQAISDGLVPIGANRNSMMDVTDAARSIGKEGGWGDPNESWINLGARATGNFFKDGLGDSLKARMDAFGDFWHHDLLWKQVGAVQAYIYNDYRNLMLDKGYKPEVAGPVAAHLANRYAGAVASENSSALMRKTLNVMLFSRSFNVGNIGAAFHDTVFGIPAGLRAKMEMEAGPEATAAGVSKAAAKARMGLVADVGMSMLLTAATSAAIAKLLQNQTADDIKEGYVRRFAAMTSGIEQHPLNPSSYNPYKLLPDSENEPGKKDRIDLGAQPGGRHEYLRLPTGKVVEDTVGWLLHPGETLEKKLSPFVKSAWESGTNDKGFGTPVMDPNGSLVKHIAEALGHVVAAQVPWDTMKTAYDAASGVATPIDKDKLVGFATGFTVSQGNPRGPESAVFHAQQDRINAQKLYAMEGVKDDIKHGRDSDAAKKLQEAGLSPRDIAFTINSIKHPRPGMSGSQARKFYPEATEEDRVALEAARRQKAQ